LRKREVWLWICTRRCARHSVRKYDDRPIEGEALDGLNNVIADCNRASGLNIQLCIDEPGAISGFLATYGRFRNVRNYIALVGKSDDSLEEKCGYFGEKIVLEATRLGLSTCWIAGTYRKGKAAATVRPGEKLLMVIAVGYAQKPDRHIKPRQLSISAM
jgi:nitroreductase